MEDSLLCFKGANKSPTLFIGGSSTFVRDLLSVVLRTDRGDAQRCTWDTLEGPPPVDDREEACPFFTFFINLARVFRSRDPRGRPEDEVALLRATLDDFNPCEVCRFGFAALPKPAF